MRPVLQLSPDPSDAPGPDSSRVPTGMETDPHADETVINQQAGEEYPRPADPSSAQPGESLLPSQLPDDPARSGDDLASAIAYALDGSGPGPTGHEPQGPARTVITEGTSGGGYEEEQRIADDRTT